MIKILLIALMSLSLSAEPLYLQEDKQKHIVGSMAIGGVATGLARHGTSDIQDVYADSIGAVVGSAISANFTWEF